MFLKNILTFIMLMSSGTFEIVQAEKLYGVDLPKIDIQLIEGKWYEVASNYNIKGCTIQTFTRGTTPNKFSSNRLSTGELNGVNVTLPLPLTYELRKDSNKISWFMLNSPGGFVAIFDIDYTSYMAYYRTGNQYDENPKIGGIFVILSRSKTLANDIYDKIVNSDFYKNADKEIPEFYKYDNIPYCG